MTPVDPTEIARGIVLFLFALTMIFGESKPEAEIVIADQVNEESAQDALQAAVYPLAMPSLASPGAMMAVVLLTDNTYYDRMSSLLVADRLVAAMVIVIVGIAWVLMRLAQPIQARIGEAGASIVSRIMGLVLASVATSNVLAGLRTYFSV